MGHEYVPGAAGIENFYGRLKKNRKNFHATRVGYQGKTVQRPLKWNAILHLYKTTSFHGV